MLRCAELGLNDETLRDMTMGMVYDLICEKMNDAEDYPTIADADDIKRVFG